MSDVTFFNPLVMSAPLFNSPNRAARDDSPPPDASVSSMGGGGGGGGGGPGGGGGAPAGDADTEDGPWALQTNPVV